jgi:signal transduction histidine kinase
MINFIYSDDGKGIAPSYLGKIFDPFFTTKRGSGGTGLGLNIVYNIVSQEYGGSIICTSEPGKGTIFTIKFPVREV